MTGMYRFPDGYATANVGHVFDVDGTDERSLTRGYVRGRASLAEYERYFRTYLKRGFENVRLAESAALMGVRETRRLFPARPGTPCVAKAFAVDAVEFSIDSKR